MDGTGVDTNTRVAPSTAASSDPAGSRPERSAARASVAGSRSYPRTWDPAATAAIAIEVPISPVPRTATRSPEVIAQRLRAVQVRVGHVGLRPVGVEVHQDPDHPGHRALDGDLARAHQRDLAQTHPPGRLRREDRDEILGAGEE